MLTLAEITSQIHDEITLDADGKGSISLRGAARLAGVNASTLSRNLIFSTENVAFVPSALAKKLTARGFQPLVGVAFSDLALAVILEYYAFDVGKRCTEQAKQCFSVFAAIGIRAWMQDLKGYVKPSSHPTPKPQPQTKPLALTEGELGAIAHQINYVHAMLPLIDLETLDQSLIDLERLDKLKTQITSIAKSHREQIVNFLQLKNLQHVKTPDGLHFVNAPRSKFIFPKEDLLDLECIDEYFVTKSLSSHFCAKNLEMALASGVEHYEEPCYNLTRKIAQVLYYKNKYGISGTIQNDYFLLDSKRDFSL